MEEEIELRPYIELLVKRWYLILGAAILAAVVAFAISSFQPPEYEATSIVAITEPSFRVQFEPRIQELSEDAQPLKAFPELATSDQVLQQLLAEIKPDLVNGTSLEELRTILSAESGSDPTLVRLSARAKDPNDAAEIVNTWAKIFVSSSNDTFGDLGEEQEEFFIEQLGKAEAELSKVEEALISFEAVSRYSIIDSELASLRHFQSSYLTDTLKITFLLQDIQGLRELLDAESAEDVSFADQLTILALQLKAFDADTSVPLQLQLDSTESLIERDRDQQGTILGNLIITLETRLEQIEETLLGLEPEILALQEQKQKIETESTRLDRNFNVADETYMSLARKVEEERISSDELTGVVKLASQASVPGGAVSTNRMRNTIAGFLLGLFAATLVILIVAWWRSP